MRRLIAFLLLLIAVPAQADDAWLEASSENFVIYSDQPEQEVRAFALRLERYHKALAEIFGLQSNKPSPSNRVTIYVVRDQAAIGKLAGGSRSIAGFYMPRAGAPTAFVSRVDSDRSRASMSEVILLHEYAHHFIISNSTEYYPHWLNEGIAEFFGTAKFDSDGSVGVGLPAEHRDLEMRYAEEVAIEDLLDSKKYLSQKSGFYDSFYGRSWLLFHYLFFSQERAGQLSAYLRKIQSGTNELEAARSAFGDLNKLNRDMYANLRRQKLNYRKILPDAVRPGPIDIRPLSAGASAMMPVRIVSKRGVDEKEAKALLPEARQIAARFPADPLVQSALAEVEQDAGNSAEAIAAADRALATNPADINAHLQKSFALAKVAKDAAEPDKAWDAVRAQLQKVRELEKDHPIALIRHYDSYISQGVEPPVAALEGLMRAYQIAPFDHQLRYTIATEFMAVKNYRKAIQTLRPIVTTTHGAEITKKASALMTKAEEALAAASAAPAAANQSK